MIWPLLLWGAVGTTSVYGANAMDNDTGGHVKRWIGNTVKSWADDGSEQERSPTNQDFNQRSGAGDQASTRQQLESSTSDQSLTTQQRQAAGVDNQQTQEGQGLWDVVGGLLTGNKNFGVLDDAGIATGAGVLSKMFGAGNIKAGIIATLATVVWNFRSEIVGGLKSAFDWAKNTDGPSNSVQLNQPFSFGSAQTNIQPGAGNVFAPEPAGG
tara:strand:+ start:1020 stop:1655 length:636 start_codon:yes stop_codon:yes gene_type:complete